MENLEDADSTKFNSSDSGYDINNEINDNVKNQQDSEKTFDRSTNTDNDFQYEYNIGTLDLRSVTLTDSPLDDYQRLFFADRVSSFEDDRGSGSNYSLQNKLPFEVNDCNRNENNTHININIEQTSYKSRLIYQIEETCNFYFQKQKVNSGHNNDNASSISDNHNNVSRGKNYEYLLNDRKYDAKTALNEIINKKVSYRGKVSKSKKILNCLEYSLPNIDIKQTLNDLSHLKISIYWKQKFCIRDTEKYASKKTSPSDKLVNPTSGSFIVSNLLNGTVVPQTNNVKTEDGHTNNMNNVDSDKVAYSLTKNQQYKLTNILYKSSEDKKLLNPNNCIIWSPEIEYVYIYGIWKLYQDVMIGLTNSNRAYSSKEGCGKIDINEYNLQNDKLKQNCLDEYNFVLQNLLKSDKILESHSTLEDFHGTRDGLVMKRKYIEFKWNSIKQRVKRDILESSKDHLVKYKEFIRSDKKNYNNLPMVQKVRGGFVKIQGTWLPIELARPLCILFAFPIRYFLVPIFGSEFSHDCEKWFQSRHVTFSLANIDIKYPPFNDKSHIEDNKLDGNDKDRDNSDCNLKNNLKRSNDKTAENYNKPLKASPIAQNGSDVPGHTINENSTNIIGNENCTCPVMTPNHTLKGNEKKSESLVHGALNENLENSVEDSTSMKRRCLLTPDCKQFKSLKTECNCVRKYGRSNNTPKVSNIKFLLSSSAQDKLDKSVDTNLISEDKIDKCNNVPDQQTTTVLATQNTLPPQVLSEPSRTLDSLAPEQSVKHHLSNSVKKGSISSLLVEDISTATPAITHIPSLRFNPKERIVSCPHAVLQIKNLINKTDMGNPNEPTTNT